MAVNFYNYQLYLNVYVCAQDMDCRNSLFEIDDEYAENVLYHVVHIKNFVVISQSYTWYREDYFAAVKIFKDGGRERQQIVFTKYGMFIYTQRTVIDALIV